MESMGPLPSAGWLEPNVRALAKCRRGGRVESR